MGAGLIALLIIALRTRLGIETDLSSVVQLFASPKIPSARFTPLLPVQEKDEEGYGRGAGEEDLSP